MYGRVNPSDSPKINLNCRNGSSGHDGNFFGMIPPTPGIATVVLANFVQKSLSINLDICNDRTTIVQRAPQRNGPLVFFTKGKILPQYLNDILDQGDITTTRNNKWSLRELLLCIH